jgi:hypothetical protein
MSNALNRAQHYRLLAEESLSRNCSHEQSFPGCLQNASTTPKSAPARAGRGRHGTRHRDSHKFDPVDERFLCLEGRARCADASGPRGASPNPALSRRRHVATALRTTVMRLNTWASLVLEARLYAR